MKFIAVLALSLALTNAVSVRGIQEDSNKKPRADSLLDISIEDQFRPEDKDHGVIMPGTNKVMQRNRDFINHDVMVNPR